MLENRYDFVYLFDVKNGNPNGDPGNNNQPRFNPLNNRGMVSDVCLKRKIRNYISEVYQGQEGTDIQIRSGVVLNNLNENAYDALDLKKKLKKGSKEKITRDDRDAVAEWMSEKFFDVRVFGGVLSANKTHPGTALRGPVQLTIADSIDPVYIHSVELTRVCRTTEARAEKGGDSEMGEKYIIPYALYVCYGTIDATATKKTGMTEEDVEKLWESLKNMFEMDQSAARGLMTARKLYVFKHSSYLGDCSRSDAYESVLVKNTSGKEYPESFGDYSYGLNKESIPEVVEICEVF